MGGEGGGRTEDAQVFGVDTLSRAASCRDGAGSPCSPGPRSGCHHSSSLSVTCWRRVDESPCATTEHDYNHCFSAQSRYDDSG